MPSLLLFATISCGLIVIVIYFVYMRCRSSLKATSSEAVNLAEANALLQQNLANLNQRYSRVIDIDAAVAERQQQIASLTTELTSLNTKYQTGVIFFEDLQQQTKLYQENLEVIEYGLYKPVFDFTTSEEYKRHIELNYAAQKEFIKRDQAAICATEWDRPGLES